MDQDAYRHVPYDVEVEQALLGSILYDQALFAELPSSLRAEHFYDPLHQRLYDVMASSIERTGMVITPLTLHAAMKNDVGLMEVGGQAYLDGLSKAAPALPNVRDFARILHDLFVRRALIRVGEDIADAAYDAPLENPALLQLQTGEAALCQLWENEADHVGGRLPVIDLANWEGRSTPERKWLVRDRIPGRNVTLLSGEGAVGKTLLAEQLAAATVLGKDWLGVTPERGPALVICCEDDEDEMHIRFGRIAEFYCGGFADLREGLFPISLVGLETIIAQPSRLGIIEPTPLYRQILRLAKAIKPALIVLDNSADMFAGNENDRAQVRQFIGLLRRMAVEVDTAVVLTSHPSVRGTETGTGISGSTAWHASVRARLYMRRPKAEGDVEPDPDQRILEVLKSNYGPAGETIALRWDNGLFVPTEGTGGHWLDKHAVEQSVDELFLRLLKRFEDQGRNVSHKPTSPTFAPTSFASDPDAKAAGIKKAAFASAMSRLFSAGQISVGTYGRPSRPYEKIVLGGKQ